MAAALREAGREVVQTREPGGTPLAEALRGLVLDPAHEGMDPWTELMIYAACRAEHRAKVIQPALQRGAVVLCDRYSDATIAYQGYGRGLPVPAVKDLCRWAEQGVRPHLTLLLDLPAEVGLGRAHRRGDVTRFEQTPLPFHQKVREGYLALSREEPDRFVVVDAARSVDEVSAAISAAVEERLEAAP